MPTPIDDAMNTVFDVARSQTSADIRSIAHHVGRAPIAAMYDWAKGNAQNRVGANIEWLRGQTVRAEVLVQSPDFEAISQSIEKTSESSEKESAVPGILVGADTKTRRFHFISDDDESFRGRFMDAISESQTVEIPARYVALIQTTTLTNYSTETEQVSHFLARLAPRP
jgi:hypothetical protein